jgi:hypothetical protein
MYARSRILHGITGLLLAGSFSSAGAALIDFETVPGGTPADQLAISNQYEASEGVTFSLSVAGTPFLEASGSDDGTTGFIRNFPEETADADVEREGYTGLGLGGFFLRFGIDTFFAVPVPKLIISYTTPVNAASAQIWDIDSNQFGTEQWRVEALDGTAQVISTIDSPVGLDALTEESLDGLPWAWAFNVGNDQIHQIVISFIGTKQENIGLSFDNFSPSTAEIPAPPAAWLFLTALAGVLHRARRRRA